LSNNFLETIAGSWVSSFGFGETRLHHQSSSDGVEGVGDDTGWDGDDLGESPEDKNVSLLGVREHNSFTGIEHTEVRCTISNNTDNWDSESSVEASSTIWSGGLLEAVNKSGVFSVGSWTNISGESGTGKIKRVDEAKRGSSGSTTGSAVTNEEFHSIGWLVGAKILLVVIFAGEVKSLSREISDDVGHVSSPEWGETLFRVDSLETVSNTLVLLGFIHTFNVVLDLEEHLNTLNGGNHSLGDGSGNTTHHEIHEEITFLFLSHCIKFICDKLNYISSDLN
jgi:hypothetical protein